MSGCITMSNEKQPEKPTIQFPCEDYHISVVADTHDGFVTILEEIVAVIAKAIKPINCE